MPVKSDSTSFKIVIVDGWDLNPNYNGAPVLIADHTARVPSFRAVKPIINHPNGKESNLTDYLPNLG